ncbi:helix-turn-helix domain-containing protein, partial [Dactylosporangium darangshiense]|uniref:helix-turn-helix domain-containing protein n=1 Tax=Dactylosporangium darangshiense TaxID=579108 RepID=UPI003CD05721
MRSPRRCDPSEGDEDPGAASRSWRSTGCCDPSGYVVTTIRDIAHAAGVGERTVYAAFPGKADLFRHVLDVATVGDERHVAVADRPEIRDASTRRNTADLSDRVQGAGEGDPVGVLAGVLGGLPHQLADGVVHQQEPVDLLLDPV